ncbi:DUF3892 domain-containing protein [Cellulosilyticum sp. I15G10I2]|uniref:DUF3892 domain-containing protein n=1 Tax=Cellulosilyticum sp. I15G10I2 TaxID=1892843 RepID=UPI0009F662AD|nr:DUF3892 domain-containing protein [Cellulosilyticum sp. I15G10I2]
MKNENQNTFNSGILPHNINQVVSKGGADAKQITKFIKQDNKVIGYVLSSGEKVTVQEAILLAKEGELSNVGVSVSKSGNEYIRSLPDDDESNNLNNLPSITEME